MEAGRRDAAQLRFWTRLGARVAPQQSPILRPGMSSVAEERWAFNECILREFPVKMGLIELVFPESPQDATEDYPQ